MLKFLFKKIALRIPKFWVISLAVLTTTAIALITPTLAAVKTPNTQATELRGVWLTNVDSDVMFERHRLTSAIQQLRKLNFNTIYPTVWNWGYTLYPSSVAKRVIGQSLDPTLGLQGRDILREIVNQGHNLEMSIIPWMEFGFMAPADSQLAKLHSDWLTNRRDDTTIWKEGPHQRVWLNPFLPEVQQFIEDLVLEIVTNYDVDGIQFDDHFGLPADFGYDPFTVNLYRQEHSGQYPPVNSQDPSWVRWRSDKITDLLRRLFFAIKRVKPECLIALAPNPEQFSYYSSLADWESWEREGLIEELSLQVYRDDISRFIAELVQPEVQAARQHIPVSIGILTGLKDKFIPIAQIQRQVEAVRNQGLAGVSFFYYETLWKVAYESPSQRQYAFHKLFPTSLTRPNILAGWTANPS